MTPSIGRRHLVTGAAALGGLAVGAGAHELATRSGAAESNQAIDFHGPRQAGVQTPPQLYASLVGLDLHAVTRDALTRLMRLLSDDAARLTQGAPALADTEPEMALAPGRLTVTFGFGPRVARLLGLDLPEMPAFKTDALQDRWRGTDLLLQIGCDDPTTLSHAQRVLLKDADPLARLVWVQRGFRDAAGASGLSMRNLMGQVDGTVNPRTPEEFDALVWSGNTTQVVVRRIEIRFDTWDRVDRRGREFTIGRTLSTGAPLTGKDEFDTPDFAATDAAGFPVIDPASHMRRARGDAKGAQFLRRGFNYDDPGDGAGLLFVAFAQDLRRQFVPSQQRIAELDLLNRWVSTIGSAHYLVPSGARPNDWVGHDELD